MAIDLAALKTEIETDPAGIGYPPWVEDGTAGAVAKQIADLLNADRQVSGFRRHAVRSADVRATFDPTELAAVASADIQILQLYVVGDVLVNFDDINVETLLRETFPNPSTTRTNLIALAQKATRAWELFAQGDTVAWDRHVLPALRLP